MYWSGKCTIEVLGVLFGYGLKDWSLRKYGLLAGRVGVDKLGIGKLNS